MSNLGSSVPMIMIIHAKHAGFDESMKDDDDDQNDQSGGRCDV
jgi:hypothetical protein